MTITLRLITKSTRLHIFEGIIDPHLPCVCFGFMVVLFVSKKFKWQNSRKIWYIDVVRLMFILEVIRKVSYMSSEIHLLHYHHHQGMLTEWILLPSVPIVHHSYAGKSTRQCPASAQSLSISVFASRPKLACQCEKSIDVSNEFILTSPAVLGMFCLSYFEGLWDWR